MEPTEYAEESLKRRRIIEGAIGLAKGRLTPPAQRDREAADDAPKDDRTGNRFNLPRSTTLPMLIALNRLGKHVYPGTVGPVEIRKRRVANRVARRQRRVNRLRGA